MVGALFWCIALFSGIFCTWRRGEIFLTELFLWVMKEKIVNNFALNMPEIA
jgi:hypothetical protein